MAIDLKLHPQTALLMLIDALMSLPKAHKLELYVQDQSVGGVVWALNDDQQSGQFLFADSDLAKLLSKFMQYVQTEGATQPEVQQPSEAAASEPSILGEQAEAVGVFEGASADATGVPE